MTNVRITNCWSISSWCSVVKNCRFLSAWCSKIKSKDPCLPGVQRINCWSLSAWSPKDKLLIPVCLVSKETNYWSLSACSRNANLDCWFLRIHPFDPFLFQVWLMSGLQTVDPCLPGVQWSKMIDSCLPGVQINKLLIHVCHCHCHADIRYMVQNINPVWHIFVPEDQKKSKDTNCLSMSHLCQRHPWLLGLDFCLPGVRRYKLLSPIRRQKISLKGVETYFFLPGILRHNCWYMSCSKPPSVPGVLDYLLIPLVSRVFNTNFSFLSARMFRILTVRKIHFCQGVF